MYITSYHIICEHVYNIIGPPLPYVNLYKTQAFACTRFSMNRGEKHEQQQQKRRRTHKQEQVKRTRTFNFINRT